MKAFLLALSFFGLITASAQKGEASWKLSVAGKTVFKATAEDEAANTVSLRAKNKKSGKLQLSYTPAAGQRSGWTRTITVYGANDAVLYKANGNTLSMTMARFAQIAKGQTELKIYVMAVPSDPNKAALVRVRRVHLVTIRLV